MEPSSTCRTGPGAPRSARLLPVLLLAGCGLAAPPVPTTPEMPALPEAAAAEDPLPATHWSGAEGTCTGEEPATFFGLVAGYSFRLEAKVNAEQSPATVRVQLDLGSRREFALLPAHLEGRGDDTRLVVYRGTTLDGRPKVFAWAGADRRFAFPREACQESLAAAAASPAATGAAEAPAGPEAPPATLAQPAARARYAGGRAVAWWQDRLAALRRDGPPALYALSLQRAKAAGLAVEERADGAVSVTPGEAP